MKYTFKVVDFTGDNIVLGPWSKVEVKTKMVEFIPSIGDPEDPSDEDEMILWLEATE